MSEVNSRAGGARAALKQAAVRDRVVGSLLVSSRFLPIWVATGLLLIATAAVAPETLSSASWSAVLPLMTFLAIAALGQMLVIMTGGLDLSTPGVIVLIAFLLVGLSKGSDSRLAVAIVACIACASFIGLISGILVTVFGLGSFIVTLGVGQIAFGAAYVYSRNIAYEAQVPPALYEWSTQRFLGISWIFWLGVMITISLAAFLRSTVTGRRFVAVGANPKAAWIVGIRVRQHTICAYVAAAVCSGVTAILLAGFIQNPGLDLGTAYGFSPIAAVVLAGTAFTGGVGSATSTWVAAFALTLLSQMLHVRGLSSALQYVVFGAAISIGMVLSGERVAAGLGRILHYVDRRGSGRTPGDGSGVGAQDSLAEFSSRMPTNLDSATTGGEPSNEPQREVGRTLRYSGRPRRREVQQQ